MKRTLSFFIIALVFSASAVAHFGVPAITVEEGTLAQVAQKPEPEIENKIIQEEEKTATFLFFGDIMLDRAVRGAVERRGGDYQFLFNNFVAPKHDLMFGNLEGASATSGTRVGSIYSFRMNPESLNTLAQNGFDILSIANNHIGDYTPTAATETKENIFAAGMKASGWGYATTSDALIIEEKNGIRVGFLAFSEFNSGGAATQTKKGILLATAPYYEPMIREAASHVDVLIVSLHAGTEYAPVQNSFQERIAKQAIDAGARIVMGHHPHVTQPVEEYNGGLIAYSLGNFIFDQNFSKETSEGGALLATYNATNKTISYTVGKIVQDRAFAIKEIVWSPEEKVVEAL